MPKVKYSKQSSQQPNQASFEYQLDLDSLIVFIHIHILVYVYIPIISKNPCIKSQNNNNNNSSMYNICYNICVLVGLLYLLSKLYDLLYRLIVIPINRYKRYGGGWALITGGSDGIGLGFCQQLAKQGFNICIVGRNRSKIQKVCQNLESLNKIKTHIIIADFKDSFNDPKFFQKIMEQAKNLDISVLVNNVGILVEAMKFGDTPPQRIQDQLTINMVPIAMMTRYMVPIMLRRYEEKKVMSLIINLSSFLSDYPAANSANYSSTKLFDNFLSEAIGYQNRGKIDCLSLRPALVTTNMTRNTDSMIHVSKNQCAQGALKAVGRRTHSYGHWSHQLQSFIAKCFSEQARNQIISSTQTKMGEKYRELDAMKG